MESKVHPSRPNRAKQVEVAAQVLPRPAHRRFARRGDRGRQSCSGCPLPLVSQKGHRGPNVPRYGAPALTPPRIYQRLIPRGYLGTRRTLAHMSWLVRAGTRDFHVRQKAIDILFERRVRPRITWERSRRYSNGCRKTSVTQGILSGSSFSTLLDACLNYELGIVTTSRSCWQRCWRPLDIPLG